MRLRKSFRIGEAGDNSLAVTGPDLYFDLHFSQKRAMAAIHRLAAHEILPGELAGLLGENSPAGVRAEWLFAVAKMQAVSALAFPTKRADIVVVPHSPEWAPVQTSDAENPRLSRFAALRVDDGRFVVESPLALAHVELTSSAAFSAFGDFANRSRRSSSAAASALTSALHSAGLLSDRDAGREFWTAADAAQHARSRIGHGPSPRVRTQEDSPARFHPVVHDQIHLPVFRAGKNPPTLDDVLAARRSQRSYAQSPVTLSQLSDLLFRSSREESRTLPDGTESVARLYPSGGSAHSLDLYAAVVECEGLPSALYLYNRRAHALERVANAAMAESLTRAARKAAVQDDAGQMLLIFASDFGTVATRYDGMAYSLILKEVGAALQTIHLVSTAMNLAACPIGSGDSGLFASAVGADYFQYTSVGEMLVGSCTS